MNKKSLNNSSGSESATLYTKCSVSSVKRQMKIELKRYVQTSQLELFADNTNKQLAEQIKEIQHHKDAIRFLLHHSKPFQDEIQTEKKTRTKEK